MHMQTISLATLANLVFQINVTNGKNWITINFDNNKQTDKTSDYQYIYIVLWGYFGILENTLENFEIILNKML